MPPPIVPLLLACCGVTGREGGRYTTGVAAGGVALGVVVVLLPSSRSVTTGADRSCSGGASCNISEKGPTTQDNQAVVRQQNDLE